MEELWDRHYTGDVNTVGLGAGPGVEIGDVNIVGRWEFGDSDWVNRYFSGVG